ncbi:MAG: dehydratase [Frankiales bacterium]|nr:dehydratase [Frankiales bacterium]
MTATDALTTLQPLLGERRGPGEWLLVDQDRVDLFADATEDHQWIHVDPERAKAGPFGGPIGHGYLSVSLIPKLVEDLRPSGSWSGIINYGSNKVRFPQPLPVGTRVRAAVTMTDAVEHPLGIMVTQKVEVEGEGLAKPVCVAETLALLLL